MKKFKVRLVFVFIGLIITGIGVGIFLFSGLGVDPASVFQTGLSKVFKVSYGTASSLSNLMILSIVLMIDRKYVSIASILAIFTIGYTADITSLLLKIIFLSELDFVFKIVLLLIGTFIMATGVSIYIYPNLGVGAIDLISEIISTKMNKPYKYVRITIDLSFVGIGYFLGGVVGLGTIIAAFLTGPAISLVRPGVYKILGNIIGEF